MKERILILCAGFLLDLVLGDPQGLWHPVRGIGAVISGTEKALRRVFSIREGREEDKGKKQAAGILLVLIVLLVSTAVCALVLALAGWLHPWLKTGISCILCWQMLAMKSLKTESMKVYRALQEKDVEKARKAVSMIVGRDTQRLTEEGITKAAVETVAENTSDGVIAPLIYMAAFGVLGGFFYKAVNTMDSMVGYKNDKYRYLGTAAARLDDVLNFIPARVAALFMIAAAYCLGMDGKNAVRIFKRDRFCHSSPNSAQTESVCAGALSVQLAGNAWYFGKLHEKPTIGDPVRRVEAEDIRRANRLLYATSLFTLLVCLMVLVLFL